MGNVRNRGRKSARKVLTPEEAENKKTKEKTHISLNLELYKGYRF